VIRPRTSRIIGNVMRSSQVSVGRTDAFALVTDRRSVLPLFTNNDDTLSVYAARYAAGGTESLMRDSKWRV